MRKYFASTIVNAVFILSFFGNALGAAQLGAEVAPKRGLIEVNQKQVELRGGFWGPRLKIAQETTIPHALDCLEADGHVTNFDKAAGVFKGPLRGHHAFDSDLYKAMEGAMYSLQHSENSTLQHSENSSTLRKRVEGILSRILAAQQPDGFLITYFIVNGLDKRWEDLRLQHQMYNAGHFFEMAVAYYQLTGDRRARPLNAAKRFADNIGSIFGPGKRYDVGGHEEIELALVKLYRATGERRYLDLARFFVDERGHAHGMERKPFDPKTAVLPPAPKVPLTSEQRRAIWHAHLRLRNGRMQDHKPLAEQMKAVGHAVRAGYIYSAMTDIARFMDAPQYERAVESIWQDVVGCKMYVNGTVGTAQYGDEGFGDPYLLPNRSYCESCASVANVLWQHRMNLLKGQARYAGVMELTLYNGVLAGISLSGDSFFYRNPLSSKGSKRSSWIGLSCCPTNLARIIPEVGGLVYARSKNRLYVNLFASGEALVKLDNGLKVKLVQKTNYPWDGHVELTVASCNSSDLKRSGFKTSASKGAGLKPSGTKESGFDLCVRIPGWALGRPVPSDLYYFAESKVLPVGLKINGNKIDSTPSKDGYVHLKRSWKAGDLVELDMPMPVRRVYANKKVQADLGKVSLMRGPITYCLEAVDNPNVDVFSVTLPREAGLHAEYRADLLSGVTVVKCEGLDRNRHPVTLTAIPYYAWANRKKGAMTVWIKETPAKVSYTKPLEVFILAGQSNMEGQGVVEMSGPG